MDYVCQNILSDQQLITLFSEKYNPVNCRSSLEGVWQFAYQVKKKSKSILPNSKKYENHLNFTKYIYINLL